MASPVTSCRTRSTVGDQDASRVIQSITKDTTPEEFDANCRCLPEYRLFFGGIGGWNALGAAAHMGNIRLVRHISQIGGRGLVDLGHEFGHTPLFLAVRYKQYQAAETLIRLNANVNLATSMGCADSSLGDVPYGATPLWQAVQPRPIVDDRVSDVAMVKLLLKNGAVAEPALDAAGTQVLAEAQGELRAERQQIVDFIDQGMGELAPTEIAELIADHVGLDYGYADLLELL